MSYLELNDGAEIYYEDIGTGRPLIFIHGWGGEGGHFAPQLEAFAAEWRVIAPDLRGHGKSRSVRQGISLGRYAEDIAELIAKLGPEKPVLIGWSMGVSIIFEYLKRYGSESLEKIVLIDMTAKVLTDSEWQNGLFGAYTNKDIVSFIIAMQRDWAGYARVSVERMFAAGSKIDPELVSWAHGVAAANDPLIMGALWAELSSRDDRTLLAEINLPTLIAYGEHSELYRPEVSMYLHEVIAGSELVAFPESGHTPQLEEPEEFNRVLREFLMK